MLISYLHFFSETHGQLFWEDGPAQPIPVCLKNPGLVLDCPHQVKNLPAFGASCWVTFVHFQFKVQFVTLPPISSFVTPGERLPWSVEETLKAQSRLSIGYHKNCLRLVCMIKNPLIGDLNLSSHPLISTTLFAGILHNNMLHIQEVLLLAARLLVWKENNKNRWTKCLTFCKPVCTKVWYEIVQSPTVYKELKYELLHQTSPESILGAVEYAEFLCF